MIADLGAAVKDREEENSAENVPAVHETAIQWGATPNNKRNIQAKGNINCSRGGVEQVVEVPGATTVAAKEVQEEDCQAKGKIAAEAEKSRMWKLQG